MVIKTCCNLNEENNKDIFNPEIKNLNFVCLVATCTFNLNSVFSPSANSAHPG